MTNEPPDTADTVGLTPTERRRLRICFWVLFLATPPSGFLVRAGYQWATGYLPIAILQIVPPELQVLLPVTGGLVGAGYCLAKLHTKDRHGLGLVAPTALFALGMVLVYLAIAYAGFALIMRHYNG